MISNFLFRVGQYFRDNRSKMIKALYIASAVMIAAALIFYGAQRLQQARMERLVHALEKEIADAEARAKAAEDRADAIQVAIETKYVELHKIQGRAVAAETRLKQTRGVIAPLKEAYEETRNNPDVPTDTTVADACSELARAGHPCG